MGVLPLDTLVPLVRLSVYEATIVEGHDAVNAIYVAKDIDEDVTASYVKLAFRQLAAAKELEAEVHRNPVTGDVATGKYFITAKGIRAVEEALQDEASLTSLYQKNGLDGSSVSFVNLAFAPASDRLVAFSDNQPKAIQARQAVIKLKEKIEQANDLPEALAPFKDVAVVEIGLLEDLLSKTVVRAAVVITLARKLLPWLAEKATGAAIGELAKRALTAILAWLA